MKRAALAALLLGAACTKGADAPNPEDRLLAKLKAEQEREKKEGPTASPVGPHPNLDAPDVNVDDGLAKVAAEPPTEVKSRKLPEKIDFKAGQLGVKLNGVETSQSISNGKVRLSTNEQFLRVDLKLTADAAATIDLSGAVAKAGDETFPIAKDVQHIVGTKNLTRPVAAGESFETVMMFELPEAALAKGVTLKLPLPAPLEVPLQ
jgi:hypothetical protein